MRAFVPLLALLCQPAHAQGVASGNLPAAPKPKLSGRPFPATFTDVAASAGLTMKFVLGRAGTKKYIVEANGSGAAFLDYDADGLLDIFLVNGSRFEPFPKGQEPISRLYRNAGGGKFIDVTAQTGAGRSGWGNGVCAGDFDADGHTDLYVTYWGANSLYRNKAGAGFEDVAPRAGVTGPPAEWSTGCTFLDYDRDGLLDLAVSSYAGFDVKKVPLPGAQPWCLFKETPVFCGPRGLPHGRITLYRNVGKGAFEDVSSKTGIADATPCYGFTMIAADLNTDGWTDLYVACDSTPSLYFRNQKDGTFRELATEAGLAYSEHGAEQAGMGLAIGDYDNDGWLDATKTNFIRDYPNLYRNLGKGIFEDLVLRAGLAVNPQYVLWGTGLEDFDNDGWKDLFQVGGHVYPEIERKYPGEAYANPRLVYRNLGGGKFEDVSSLAGPGVAARHSSRGAAFGDFDNDGDIDVLIMNMDQPPSLLRNDLSSRNHWLKLQLLGSATGATVTVEAAGRKQSAALLSQSSFLSVNDPRLHFGLGQAEKADRITVRWPSGRVEEFGPFAADALVPLREGTGK
ncbi:MAG: CRTAC1 family protein [Acidimicrobiia bacterium]|nr:CRTAC1 family protein [Acidimicrobiia bacterium]